jgi:hypothetical protein
MRRDLQTH